MIDRKIFLRRGFITQCAEVAEGACSELQISSKSDFISCR